MKLAATTDGSRTAPPSHPRHLLEMDRSYLVGWGSRELLMASVLSLVACSGLVCLGVNVSPWWYLGLVPVLGLGAVSILFFRNPRRTVPDARGLLVAPADGEVWDVTEVQATEHLAEPCLCIGIFLSIFSVHVNRAPASGRIEAIDYRPGAFHDARLQSAARENESNTLVIACDETEIDGTSCDDSTVNPPGEPVRLAVKQISGAVARRIICPLSLGARVARGGLLGMIKYGSRTELHIPQRLQPVVQVRVGDKVTGGETVLATWGAGTSIPRETTQNPETNPQHDSARPNATTPNVTTPNATIARAGQ